MQNPQYTIPIPQNIVIGKLIGREGCNLKPIAERTGTYIYVDSNTNPAQIKIRINKKK
jgi:rRNA processing protein Krr1/Pno1